MGKAEECTKKMGLGGGMGGVAPGGGLGLVAAGKTLQGSQLS